MAFELRPQYHLMRLIDKHISYPVFVNLLIYSGNPIGRTPDYKRRGRSKKPGGLVGAIRNGNPRNGSTPSPGLPTPGAHHLHGMGDMYEENRNIHSQYPFATDLRNHLAGGNGEYVGRMSPPPAIRGDGSFVYPGQDWPSEYPPCGLQGYYPGK